MQKRFIKYKDNLVSFDTNVSRSGIIPGALYRGFDTLNVGSNLNFTISHELKGEVMPDINENDTTPTGVWMTRQGVTIKEDEPIPLDIQSNAGNNSIRKDYIVGHHHHDVLSPGGLAATYDVLMGPTNSLALPADPEGNDWVILGILIIPALADNTSGMKLQRPKIPSLGNTYPALLDEPNRFVEQQQEYQAGTKIITSAAIDGLADRNAIGDIDGGNIFLVDGTTKLDLIPDKPNGTEIQLYFNKEVTLRPFVSQLTGGNIPAGYTKGLRPIVINYDTADNLVIKINQIATFRKFDKGGAYAVDNKVFGDFWKLISVSDTPDRLRQNDLIITNLTNSVTTLATTVGLLQAQIDFLDWPGRIQQVKLFGNILDYFTASGRGKPDSPWPKHQICTGIIGTPDLRDKNLRGYNGAISDYNSDSGDLTLNLPNTLKLTNDYIPEHTHRMFANNQPGDTDLSHNGNTWVSFIRGHGDNHDYVLITGDAEPSMGISGKAGTADAGQTAIDLRSSTYYVIFIMKLTPQLIAANPYTGA